MKIGNKAIAAGIACMATTPACLYAADAGPEADTGTGPALEEVLVTARKREENIQTVPVAITALSGDALLQHGVQTLEDLRFVAPSLQISPSPFGSSIPSVSIRGQRPIESVLTLDPSIGIYFDDVVAERPHGMNAALFDLQSVQVLKGPQGTLFGRNTTGGAVLITPAKASFEKLEAKVGVAAGNYSTLNLSGMLNIPVSETVAVRFALQTHKHDGYTKNLSDNTQMDDADDQSYRATMTIKPTSNIVSTTTYQYFKESTKGNGIRLIGVNPAGVLGSAAIRDSMSNVLSFLDTQDWHSVSNDIVPGENVETHHLGNITTWELGGITLKNVIGGHKVRSYAAFDFDGTTVKHPSSITSVIGPIGIFNSRNTLDVHQFSEEFQVLGTAFDNRLDWITGLYYFREAGRDTQVSQLGAVFNNDAKGENKSRSIFAQGTYRFESLDKLSMTLGLRNTWDDRMIDQYSQQIALSGVTSCRIMATPTTPVPLNLCARHLTFSDSAPSWGATFDYALTPDILAYVARRRGYKSGGLQLRSYGFGAPLTFKPEFVDDWEVGLKSTFDVAGIPARVNAAIYKQDYKDIQRTVSVPAVPPATGLFTLVYNAGQATIEGGELEVTLLPTKGLELTLFANHTSPRYDVFRESTATGFNDLSGSHFAMIPEDTAGASFKYELPLFSTIGKLSVSADWYHQSVMEITDKNVVNGRRTGEGQIPSYQLTNAYLDWKDMMSLPVDLRFYVKNLSDEEYAVGGNSVISTGFYTYILGAPRTYGLELNYRFSNE